MLREITGWSVVLLLLGALVGFAWLTRHPDVAWLERAEEWPLVGPLAQRFRRAYLGPPPEERERAARAAAEGGGTEVVIVNPPPPDEPIDLTWHRESPARGAAGATAGSQADPSDGTGRRSRPATPAEGSVSGRRAPAPAGEPREGAPDLPTLVPRGASLEPPIRKIYTREWLLPGTLLRAEPTAASAEVERLRELASVPLLGRSGDWLRVQLRGRVGWVDPATPVFEARPRGRLTSDDRYLAQPPEEVLREVEERLGLRRPNRKLGPYALYSDVEDEEALELLDGVAGRLHEAYGARYGLGVPERSSGLVVVLFADEADYRAVARTVSSRPAHRNGFAIGGLAISYLGDRPWPSVVSTLAHELTHTLNRYAIGSGLPPWLEEGMAGDLGAVWVEDPDAPVPGLIDAAVEGVRWWPQRLLQVSAAASVDSSCEALTVLESASFYVPTGRNEAHSQLFVRCLLDGGNGELAEGFRRFLVDVARGREATPQLLLESLGSDWPEIEATCVDFRRAFESESRSLLPADWQWYGPE